MTELPTTFGKYFLTEKLATGGMAEIYLAKLMGPGGFEKQLVIKQIHPKLTGQRHFVDLFVTEAKTLVTLTHGNIVPVYELGVIDDTYFIAMEYIDGPTLYRLTEALARQNVRMHPALAAWIAARILEGLDYAHRKGEGVIHRDLSPRNVMLSRDGDVKLVDFGIAVTLGSPDDSAAQSAPTGSFPYMSPEQVRREVLSGQTDLFSVGVLLWEMLTGERLFARPSPDDTLTAVTDGAIARPSEKRSAIHAKLDEVVMRALERAQDARWPDAGEMLAALNKYLYSLDEPPGPRELGALVAKYCPPETRRLPTHAPDPDVPRDGRTEVTPAAPKGPSTAVIPRELDAQPKGKGRARTETFATNIELEAILERPAPVVPIPTTPVDDDIIQTKVSASGSNRAIAVDDDPPDPGPRTSNRSIPRAERSQVDIPVETVERVPPPSNRLLVAAAIGTLLLGGGAIFMFLRNRNQPTSTPDATINAMIDVATPTPDAEPDATPMAIDAMELDAGKGDGGAKLKPDANVATTPIDAPRVTGSGTLKVGANPWGEVIIDGTPRGRTPFEATLPAGKHTVEIIFKGEDPPRTQKKTIDLAPGETEQVDADFTKPN